jgi:hypothetical protein
MWLQPYYFTVVCVLNMKCFGSAFFKKIRLRLLRFDQRFRSIMYLFSSFSFNLIEEYRISLCQVWIYFGRGVQVTHEGMIYTCWNTCVTNVDLTFLVSVYNVFHSNASILMLVAIGELDRQWRIQRRVNGSRKVLKQLALSGMLICSKSGLWWLII